MTDESASGEPRVASAPPRPADPERITSPRSADPERAESARSRTDPMSVPATAPVWTYQHSFEPTASEPASTGPRAEAAGPAPADAAALELGWRRRSPALGVMALLLAIAAGGVEVGAIVISTAGEYTTGTVLAFVAIAASGAAVVIGIVAVILRAGRAVAIVGAVLGVLVNPLLLVTVLGLLAGASSID